MAGRAHVLNHASVPAACFTHPEVSFVGATEEAAREAADKGGYGRHVAVVKTSFKANSKALAEKEGEGLAKMIYRKDTGCARARAGGQGEGRSFVVFLFFLRPIPTPPPTPPPPSEILGVHIIGLHAADLIHEASNAVATGQRVQDIKFNVHAHPTLSEVLDELFKSAAVDEAAAKTAKAAGTPALAKAAAAV